MNNTVLTVIIVISVLLAILIFLGILVLVIYLRKRRGEYERIALDEALSKSVKRQKETPMEEKQEAALMNVRMYLRASVYELIRPLFDMGSRKDKFYFLVRNQRKDYVLSLTGKGKACFASAIEYHPNYHPRHP